MHATSFSGSAYAIICVGDVHQIKTVLLEGIFYGVEAGIVVVNPFYYQEEDNDV